MKEGSKAPISAIKGLAKAHLHLHLEYFTDTILVTVNVRPNKMRRALDCCKKKQVLTHTHTHTHTHVAVIPQWYSAGLRAEQSGF
jgi:hypothetical protein